MDINLRQPEIHPCPYTNNHLVCGSSFSIFLSCTLMQLIIRTLRVENDNILIVGPALIDTVVLFEVRLNNSYYT